MPPFSHFNGESHLGQNLGHRLTVSGLVDPGCFGLCRPLPKLKKKIKMIFYIALV